MAVPISPPLDDIISGTALCHSCMRQAAAKGAVPPDCTSIWCDMRCAACQCIDKCPYDFPSGLTRCSAHEADSNNKQGGLLPKKRRVQHLAAEERGQYFNELSSEETHALFQDFVAVWNGRKLPARYYAGISVPPLRRTQHRWQSKVR